MPSRPPWRGALAAVIVVLFGCAALPALAARTCTPDEKTAADAVLWLNGRDKQAALKRHLPFGEPRPTRATTGEHLLIQRDYVIDYDDQLLAPVWTAHRLDAKRLGKAPRVDCFRRDPRIDAPAAALPADYDEPIFDQGHMTPNADMTVGLNAVLNSFVLSNMTPQYCHFNQGVWQIFESIVRLWAADRGTIYVITGSVFDRDDDARRDADDAAKRMVSKKGKARVAVPSHFYKIVAAAKPGGGIETITILLPHDQTDLDGDAAVAYLADHIRPVGQIEKVTGLDFFPEAQGSISQATKFWAYSGKAARSMVGDRCRATTGKLG